MLHSALEIIQNFVAQTPDGRTVIKEITEFKVHPIHLLEGLTDIRNKRCGGPWNRCRTKRNGIMRICALRTLYLCPQTDENGNRVKCTRRIQTTKKTVRVNRYESCLRLTTTFSVQPMDLVYEIYFCELPRCLES